MDFATFEAGFKKSKRGGSLCWAASSTRLSLPSTAWTDRLVSAKRTTRLSETFISGVCTTLAR